METRLGTGRGTKLWWPPAIPGTATRSSISPRRARSRAGGMDGTGEEQQMGKLRCFLGTLAIGAQRAAQQDQGQRSGAPAASLGGIRRCGYTRDPWPDPAAGESPFSLGQVLPGHSPDIDADAAVWGRPRRKAAGTQCLAMVQQWVNHFLAGMAIPARKSNAAAGPSCYKGRDIPPTHWPDSWHPANAHPTPALVRTIAKS